MFSHTYGGCLYMFDNPLKIFQVDFMKNVLTLNLYGHSLVCRCPFVGETDRATLLRVGEGTLHWESPDVACRSPEAQSFLHLLLQPDPE